MEEGSIGELTKRFVHESRGVVLDSARPNCTEAYLTLARAVRFCEFNHEVPIHMGVTVSVASLDMKYFDELVERLVQDGCPYGNRVLHEDGAIHLLYDLILTTDVDADMTIFSHWLLIVEDEVDYLDRLISKVVISNEKGPRLDAHFSSDAGHA